MFNTIKYNFFLLSFFLFFNFITNLILFFPHECCFSPHRSSTDKMPTFVNPSKKETIKNRKERLYCLLRRSLPSFALLCLG